MKTLLSFIKSLRPRKHRMPLEPSQQNGVILSEDFKAKRAFQIEEFEDEGSHYVVELEDGSVLSLVGQYLFEYEPITDDGENNQPRTFPCTEFTIKRNKADEIIDIVCRGEVIEPECLVPPFTEEDILNDRILEDDLLITDKTYDQIKRECQERNRK